MSDYANDFTGKCEDVAQAYLATSKAAGNLAAFATDQLLAGEDNENVGLPRVVCVCDSADVAEFYDGNWEGDLEIKVIASATDTSRDEFREMCGEVFAHFFQAPADVCTALSSATIKFTAQAVEPRRQQKSIVADESGRNAWREKSLFLRVKGCGSVVA